MSIHLGELLVLAEYVYYNKKQNMIDQEGTSHGKKQSVFHKYARKKR